MVELMLVEPKASKRPSAVAHAMSRLLAQLEAVILPMVRTRADFGRISSINRRLVGSVVQYPSHRCGAARTQVKRSS